jgi:hypothetical protein
VPALPDSNTPFLKKAENSSRASRDGFSLHWYNGHDGICEQTASNFCRYTWILKQFSTQGIKNSQSIPQVASFSAWRRFQSSWQRTSSEEKAARPPGHHSALACPNAALESVCSAATESIWHQRHSPSLRTQSGCCCRRRVANTMAR